MGVTACWAFHHGEGLLHTALHVIARREKLSYGAIEGHDARLFEMMVQNGLDPLAEDGRGRTSLDVAAACENKDILDLFRYKP